MIGLIKSNGKILSELIKLLVVTFIISCTINPINVSALGLICQNGSDLECIHSNSEEVEGLRFVKLKKSVGNMEFSGSLINRVGIDQVNGEYELSINLDSSIYNKNLYLLLGNGNIAVLRDFSGDEVNLQGIVSEIKMISISGENMDNLIDIKTISTSSIGDDVGIYDMCSRDGKLNFSVINNRDVDLVNVAYYIPDTGERVSFDIKANSEVSFSSSIGMRVEIFMDGVLVNSVDFDGISCDGFSEDVYKICEVSDVDRVILNRTIDTGVKVRVRENLRGTSFFINVPSGSEEKVPEFKNFLFR